MHHRSAKRHMPVQCAHARWTRAIRLVSVATAVAGAYVHAAATASGATVKYGSAQGLTFVAQRGEANDVSVRVALGTAADARVHAVTVTDTKAPLTAGSSCTAVDVHTVTCSGRIRSFSAALRDLDDTLRFSRDVGEHSTRVMGLEVYGHGGDDLVVGATGSTHVNGGPGNDILDGAGGPPSGTPGGRWAVFVGGPGDDALYGTDGANALVPGVGADYVDGRGGDDHLRAGGDSQDADVLIGGDGADWVFYDLRRKALFIDLGDDQPDGAAGEGDRLAGIENVSGGHGDDIVIGDAAANVLSGSFGRDRLVGRGGDDLFATGSGFVMPGSAPRRRGDRVSCGNGRDHIVSGAGARDFAGSDCERISFSERPDGLEVSAAARSTPGKLRFTLRCPRFVRAIGMQPLERAAVCSATLTITRSTDRRRILAMGSTPAGAWARHRFTASLTSLGRRLHQPPARRRGLHRAARYRRARRRSARLPRRVDHAAQAGGQQPPIVRLLGYRSTPSDRLQHVSSLSQAACVTHRPAATHPSASDEKPSEASRIPPAGALKPGSSAECRFARKGALRRLDYTVRSDACGGIGVRSLTKPGCASTRSSHAVTCANLSGSA